MLLNQSATRMRILYAILACVLVVCIVIATSVGPAGIGWNHTLSALLRAIPGVESLLAEHLAPVTPAQSGLILGVRLPRVILAALTGAGLSIAGAVMQGVFANSLAEPGVTGVSAGAAVGAVFVIVFGGVYLPPWFLTLTAFLGALAATVAVQLLAGIRGSHGATLLLVGIAINALLGAVVSATIANADSSDKAQGAMFWLNGDLSAASWRDVSVMVIPLIFGSLLLLFLSPELNLLTLGDAQATSTGVNTQLMRHLLLGLAALVTAAAVSVTGIISFVGLVVPHICRLLFGANHRRILPLSLLLGAIFLVLADLVARLLLHPVVLQTGTVTAFIGAPVLLYLVARRAR
ncbi:MAG: iron ABC transporter permease [Mobiluncus porci]|uniref:FecCD family ABC transporter permease n=1 Tax=Mobiluncus porci TaxID=2652278 RepID=UPI0023F06CB3|nr:iron ABC transporter permease [Mobiluncus porci]MDD7541274.1 iron ABC transporter permease [Mobiluncus porci]MDY5749482.1 iron ABC transporter permease [Mobiluncus porci]